MSLESVRLIAGRAMPLMADDVDTDVIIPARFLRCVTFDGLGAHAFRDLRYDADGEPRAHVLNDARFSGASVLLAGRNFGCGSSREHAPQALARAGYRAIVAESFAGIFFGNALGLGLVCVTLPRPALDALAADVAGHPDRVVEIDLSARRLRADASNASIGIGDAAREALLSGRYDPLAELLERCDHTARTLQNLPWTAWNTL
jgi:3-isopropylmalate/(R)-2-methylmalate dehydratase small subunit